MGLIVQIINKSTKINKAQELQICSKQASIHEKMQFIVQLIEKEVLLLLLVQLQLLFLMMNRLFTCKIKEQDGFACVKHCARGFTAASSRE